MKECAHRKQITLQSDIHQDDVKKKKILYSVYPVVSKNLLGFFFKYTYSIFIQHGRADEIKYSTELGCSITEEILIIIT